MAQRPLVGFWLETARYRNSQLLTPGLSSYTTSEWKAFWYFLQTLEVETNTAFGNSITRLRSITGMHFFLLFTDGSFFLSDGLNLGAMQSMEKNFAVKEMVMYWSRVRRFMEKHSHFEAGEKDREGAQLYCPGCFIDEYRGAYRSSLVASVEADSFSSVLDCIYSWEINSFCRYNGLRRHAVYA